MMVGSPGIALTWQLWSQVRRPALAAMLYLSVLTVWAHLPGALAWRSSVLTASVFLGFGLLFVLGVYALPGKDVLGAQSGYPDWMLVLPVRTMELVFWPMLHACGAAMLAWVVPMQSILRPLGIEAPLVWPAVMLASMMAWLQAILWVPCGLPYLRLGLMIVLLPSMVIAGMYASLTGVTPFLLAGGFAALIPIAFGIAVAGVNVARRGDTPEWRWRRPGAGVGRVSMQSRGGFTSAGRAQFWYEWRSSGLALPIAMGTLGILWSLPLLWVHELVPIGMEYPHSEFGSVEVNLWVRLQTMFLMWPPLLASLLGYGRRRYDTAQRDPSLHPFLGTRPVREGLFVGAKLKSAALSTAVTWAVTLGFFFTWLLMPGRSGQVSGTTLGLLLRHGNLVTATLFGVILAILVFWTWKCQVQGLCADLCGRRWVIGAVPAVLHSLVIVGYGYWIEWSSRAGPQGLEAVSIPSAWPWVLGLALLAKASLSVLSIGALRRQGEVSPARVALWMGAWGATVAALAAGTHWVAHTGRYASELAAFLVYSYLPLCGGGAPQELLSWPYLFVLSALFVPIARLLLAPLALSWNRHR